MGWMTGAGLGFLLGGPLGAVVGGSLQHLVGKGAEEIIGQARISGGQGNPEAMFVTYLVSILTKIAMADGQVAPEERRVIHNFLSQNLRYTGENLQYIDMLIQQTEKVNPDLRQIAESFRQTTNTQSTLMLLDICYQIAMIDGVITTEEQGALDTLASSLHINPHAHQRIKYKYTHAQSQSQSHGSRASASSSPMPNDYTTLGVTTNASDDEVKKAYRQMASQYHPDKVAHLGKELVDFANQKFSEINTSYNNIKKQRGL